MGEENESVQMCIDSFFRNNISVNMWVYNLSNYINCNICDANTIIPLRKLDKFWSYQDKSDWVRLNLIYKIGGWYVDTDCYCLSKFEINDINVVSWIDNKRDRLNNSIFKFSKESEILKYNIHTFDKNFRVPGYMQFNDSTLKFKENISILDYEVLMYKFDNIIPKETKVIHLYDSANCANNIELINKINKIWKQE